MKSLTKAFSIIIFLNLYFGAIAQDKFEREFQVEASLVPYPAKEYISNCCAQLEMNWYKEESQDGITYEAKSFDKKNHYSIEFNEKGELIDIEKLISFRTLSQDIRQKIRMDLDLYFSKWKIRKVQTQWHDDSDKLRKFLTETKKEIDSNFAFEIVVEGKKKKIFEVAEFLFDENGNRLLVKKVIERSNTNLEF